MKRKENQRKNHHKGRGKAITSPRTQIRNSPQEVIVTMNLGVQYSLALSSASTVTSADLNNPLVMVLDWVIRSNDFLTYRVVAVDIFAAPTNSTAAPGTQTRQWVSALIEDSIGGSPVPTSANALVELPQSQLRPMDTSNVLYRRRIRWRCRDLNGLVYENVTSAPALRTVKLYTSVIGTSPLAAGWSISINGRITVEFKGLASV